ncbi:MAG: Lrp/AsnC family transcriptional regulator [Coriobacteriia bacterium]|nr:Lrp/AsnC family transcriptional regulator [Coriobacteriia bacterium]
MCSVILSDLDKRALSRIQAGFPIESRPYAALASDFGATEAEVLASVRSMREQGVIRRIGAIFDSARLGYRSTLCAIAAPPERIDEVAGVISAYPNVTHNYERQDRYSVWFTLIAESQERIDAILAEIAAATGIDDILDLPAIRLFKIRVDFDLTGQREVADAPKMTKPADAEVASLAADEKALAELLQGDLPDVGAPFAALAETLRADGVDVGEGWVLGRARAWVDTGVIRRFGAAIKHHKTGFTSNAMGVWDCPDEAELERVGAIMAGFAEVSHCYQRPRRATWPHDLYTMIHGRSHEECEAVAERIREATGLPPARLLYSVREFKKASMRYFA